MMHNQTIHILRRIKMSFTFRKQRIFQVELDKEPLGVTLSFTYMCGSHRRIIVDKELFANIRGGDKGALLPVHHHESNRMCWENMKVTYDWLKYLAERTVPMKCAARLMKVSVQR